MVGVAKRPKAPDCGSGIRGFESHHPPHKKRQTVGSVFFYGPGMGFEEPGPCAARVKKCPGDTFLGQGRIPGCRSAIRKDRETASSFSRKEERQTIRSVFFYGPGMGLEEPGHGKAVANNMPVAYCLGRGESLDAGVRSGRIVKRHSIFMS